MDIEEAISRCATKLDEYKQKVDQCSARLMEYQKKIDILTSAMSAELLRLKKNLIAQTHPQIVYIERTHIDKNEEPRKQHKFKYRTIDSFGVENFFMTKRELLNSLDITNYELKQHLAGKYTVLDDLQIVVEKLYGR